MTHRFTDTSSEIFLHAQASLLQTLQCLENELTIPDSSLGETDLPFNPQYQPSVRELYETAPADESEEWFFCGVRGHGLQNLYWEFHVITPSLRIAVALPYDRAFSSEEERKLDNQQIEAVAKTLLLLLGGINSQLDAFAEILEKIVCALCISDFSEYMILDESGETFQQGDSWQTLINYLDDSYSGIAIQERLYV